MVHEIAFEGGVLCISIDFELLWGVREMRTTPHERAAAKARELIPRLLQLFERHGVRATWATVGHLFLDGCDCVGGKAHPRLIRPGYDWWPQDDWLSDDPCSDSAQDPLWYAPDLIEEIREVDGQEVGSHSFAHLIFGDPGCSAEAARSDLEHARSASARQGVHPRSFVFPRNSVGHFEELRKAGFKTYRSPDPYPISGTGLLANMWLLGEMLTLHAPPVSRPVWKNGLLDIPGSMIWLSRDGFRRCIPMASRVVRAKKGIDSAAEQDAVFHLWFHIINLGSDTERMLAGLEEVLAHAAERGVRTMHMGDIYDAAS